MSKLDKMLVSPSWICSFLNSHLKALLKVGSDHSPLLLKIEEEFWKNTPFRLKNMWLDHSELEVKAKEWWNAIFHGI